MVDVRLNWLDRGIGWLAPRTAYRRGIARAALTETRGYDGAAKGRRTSGWRAPQTSADAEIAKSLPLLRNRSRDLNRNNPHARKGKSVWVSNIVGTGIWPRANSGNAALDKKANDLFAEWAASCDADGQLDFGGIQELLVGEMIEAGDSLVRRRLRRPEDGLPVPLQLQVIEGDQLDESRNQDLGTRGKVVNGVEFGPIGQRSAYWMFPEHPGNSNFLVTSTLLSQPVPADQVVHLYRKERSQTRGTPWCSAIIMPTRDLADYGDAERTRKKIESCVVAIVMGQDASDGLAPLTQNGMAVKDSSGNPVEQFEPGLIAYSESGKTVQFNNPGQSGGFVDYMRVGLHEVAAGFLLPYELLSGDLSQVNFSSARVGLIEFRRLVEAVQHLCVIPMALTPIWNWFVGTAHLAGKLPVPSIPVEWDTPRFESVQPLDDANADIAVLRAGLDSPYTVIGRRTGRDPEIVMDEIAKWNAGLDRRKVILDSDPRNTAKSGADPSPSQQSQEKVAPAPNPKPEK